LWIISISKLAVIWGVQLIAGFYLSPEEFAKLAVATRVSTLVVFVLIAGNMVVSPQFSVLWGDNKKEELKIFTQKATIVISALALPLFVAGVVFSSNILSFFGDEFVDSTAVLKVLLFGQFINAVSGSVGVLLVMTGYENDLKRVTLFFSVLAKYLNNISL